MDIILALIKKVTRIIIGKDRLFRIQKWRYSKISSSILKKNGEEALNCFNEISGKMGKIYWLYWGTLLGAYRDHDFIKTDDDIDIGMFRNDITLDFIDELINHDFVFLHSIFDKKRENIHIAFSYKGLKFDLYSFSLPNDRGEIVGFTPGKSNDNVIFPIIRTAHKYGGISTIQFKNITVKVLSNEEDVLKILYGDSFMKPIPKYSAEYAKKQYNSNYYIVSLDENYALKGNFDDLKQMCSL